MHQFYPLYASERWAFRAKTKLNIGSRVNIYEESIGYNWTDYKTNFVIINELKIISVTVKINAYKSNWTNHVNRMLRNRLTWIFKNYTKRQKKSRKPYEESDGRRNETGKGQNKSISITTAWWNVFVTILLFNRVLGGLDASLSANYFLSKNLFDSSFNQLDEPLLSANCTMLS